MKKILVYDTDFRYSFEGIKGNHVLILALGLVHVAGLFSCEISNQINVGKIFRVVSLTQTVLEWHQ